MTAFATVDQLADFLGEDNLADARKRQGTLLLDLASGEIRRFARQTLSLVENDTVLLAGNWTAILELPEQPVTGVGTVKLEGVTLTDATWDQRHSIRRFPLDAYGGAALTGPSWMCEGHWGGPHRTVEVTYSHGFETIPDDLVGRTLVIAARAMANPIGVTQEAIGSYSVTYARQAGIYLDRHDRQMLRAYRRGAL